MGAEKTLHKIHHRLLFVLLLLLLLPMQQSDSVGGVCVTGDLASGATVSQLGQDGVLVKVENNGILPMYFAPNCTPPRKIRVEPWHHASLEGFHFVMHMDEPAQQEVSTAL